MSGRRRDGSVRLGARLLLLLAALWCVVLATAPGAGAQQPTTTTAGADEGGEQVRGTIIDKKGTSDLSDDKPVKGLRIVVTDRAGRRVGDDTTDEKGKFAVALPHPGNYTARLDTKGLPKGIELDEAASTIEFYVNPGQSRPLIFDVGSAARKTEGKVDLLLQALVDGAYFGLIIAMASVGLSLIYGTTGLVNFAHGELVTLGAILAYFFNHDLNWPLLLAAPIAVVLTAAGGWLLDAGFWGPLRRRGSGNIAQMVISIGLALVLVNVYLYTFGGRTRPYIDFHAQPEWTFGAVGLPPKKLVSMVICVALLVAVGVALQRTRTGKAMRAIADNPDLAASSGVPVDSVIRLVWLFGAGLAAVGGILFSVAQDVNFEEGSSMLLLLFAAITLGGLGEAYGALAGGFVVGLFVSVSAVWIPTELKNVGALVVLILVLLVRPQGILGRAERIG